MKVNKNIHLPFHRTFYVFGDVVGDVIGDVALLYFCVGSKW